MSRYEYKVVPAPQKGTKAKGVKTPEGRFAVSVEQILNQMGRDGWEYQRAELLPSEDRSGLTGSSTNWRNLLVFRRRVEEAVPQPLVEPASAIEDDGTPRAVPVPGPEESVPDPEPKVSAPAPIAAETNDPPLTLSAEDSPPKADESDPTPKA
ncbi:DUF4177 domain-containing protein [Ruegeria sp. HKCCC1038]|uniref:DUF4177 domain-containing protein n=1 Tax=Ruegeria sp. HKCCC1038 TaxID=2682982 RepID=UPI001489AE38|nr:DUF4177 domain-containing protein [Ruegeria sp. HKCCC1038]